MSLCDDLYSLFADSFQKQQRVIVDHIRKKVANGEEFVVFDAAILDQIGALHYKDFAKLQAYLEDNGIRTHTAYRTPSRGESNKILVAYGWTNMTYTDVMELV